MKDDEVNFNEIAVENQKGYIKKSLNNYLCKSNFQNSIESFESRKFNSEKKKNLPKLKPEKNLSPSNKKSLQIIQRNTFYFKKHLEISPFIQKVFFAFYFIKL